VGKRDVVCAVAVEIAEDHLAAVRGPVAGLIEPSRIDRMGNVTGGIAGRGRGVRGGEPEAVQHDVRVAVHVEVADLHALMRIVVEGDGGPAGVFLEIDLCFTVLPHDHVGPAVPVEVGHADILHIAGGVADGVLDPAFGAPVLEPGRDARRVAHLCGAEAGHQVGVPVAVQVAGLEIIAARPGVVAGRNGENDVRPVRGQEGADDVVVFRDAHDVVGAVVVHIGHGPFVGGIIRVKGDGLECQVGGGGGGQESREGCREKADGYPCHVGVSRVRDGIKKRYRRHSTLFAFCAKGWLAIRSSS
jgi:hypothetical protein